MDIFLSKSFECFEYLFTGHTVYLEKGKKSGPNIQGIRVIPIENKIIVRLSDLKPIQLKILELLHLPAEIYLGLNQLSFSYFDKTLKFPPVQTFSPKTLLPFERSQ